jgi:hypothetical protein
MPVLWGARVPGTVVRAAFNEPRTPEERNMHRTQTISTFAVLALVLALFTAPALHAQREYLVPIPSKIPRETVKDEDGMLQWAKYDVKDKKHRCPTCTGEGKAECQLCLRIEKFADRDTCPECDNPPSLDRDKPNFGTCRTCAGEGHLPDILEQSPCPSCVGAAVIPCPRCVGIGGFPQDGSDDLIKCTVCKGEGVFRCSTCRGKRLVETARLKPSLAEADLEDLEEAMEALVETEEVLKELVSNADGRKDAKTWAGKEWRIAFRTFPVLKLATKNAAELSKDHASGPQAQGQAQMAQDAFDRYKAGIDLYLQYQRRALELAVERQKANAAVEAGK